MTKQAQLTEANQLGVKARQNNKSSAPGNSPEIRDMIKGRKPGQCPEGEATTVEIFSAFSNGWHAQNLKESDLGTLTLSKKDIKTRCKNQYAAWKDAMDVYGRMSITAKKEEGRYDVLRDLWAEANGADFERFKWELEVDKEFTRREYESRG